MILVMEVMMDKLKMILMIKDSMIMLKVMIWEMICNNKMILMKWMVCNNKILTNKMVCLIINKKITITNRCNKKNNRNNKKDLMKCLMILIKMMTIT
jgi:hypothetical protein